MRLQISRVDHHRPALGARRGQPLHHPSEDPHLTPPLPAVIERLVRLIILRRIPPAQPVTVHEDDPAEHPPIIHPRPAVAPREIRREPHHLLIRQPYRSLKSSLLTEPESDRSPHINGA